MAAVGSIDTTKILENLLNILKEEGVFDRTRNQPVIQFLHPHELMVIINYYIYCINFDISRGEKKSQ